MRKHDKHSHSDPWEQEHYQTGDTNPPGKGGGIMAFVLILVILVVGFARTLNLINLHALQQFAQNGTPSATVSLFPDHTVESLSGTPESIPMSIEKLGLAGNTVSDFDRRYYEMPRGVQVTEVSKNSSACVAGIRCGDVILSVADHPVEDRASLEELLQQYAPGTQVQVEFYRPQTETTQSVTLTIS